MTQTTKDNIMAIEKELKNALDRRNWDLARRHLEVLMQTIYDVPVLEVV